MVGYFLLTDVHEPARNLPFHHFNIKKACLMIIFNKDSKHIFPNSFKLFVKYTYCTLEKPESAIVLYFINTKRPCD